MKGLVALYGSEEVVRNRIWKVSRSDGSNAFIAEIFLIPFRENFKLNIITNKIFCY